ncbi:MAG: hypothetical protein JWP97_4117 [Labilithrix sp.]|nr:hypothetical protein [Labilithrix sp.]
MASRSKQRSQERKVAATEVTKEPPPTFEELRLPLLGFSFYMLATGTLAMGLGQLLYFARLQHADVPPMLLGWILPLGQIMGLLGLVLGWRTTERAEKRLMAAGTLLWLSLFALAIERGAVQRALLGRSITLVVLVTEVAPWVGWAAVLGIVTLAVRTAARAVGGATWPMMLGLALVVAHAAELAWPALVPTRHAAETLFALRNSQIGALGLLLTAAGLYIVGRRLLPDDAVDKAKATGKKVTPRLAPTTSLLSDGAIMLAGVTFALCASVAAADPLGASASETAALAGNGGLALTAAVLFVALRRNEATRGRPARLALGSLLAMALYLGSLVVASRSPGPLTAGIANGLFALPAVLAAAALHATATAVTGRDARVLVQHHGRRRAAMVCVAAAMVLLVVGLFLGERQAELAFVLSVVSALTAFIGFARALVKGPPGLA